MSTNHSPWRLNQSWRRLFCLMSHAVVSAFFCSFDTPIGSISLRIIITITSDSNCTYVLLASYYTYRMYKCFNSHFFLSYSTYIWNLKKKIRWGPITGIVGEFVTERHFGIVRYLHCEQDKTLTLRFGLSNAKVHM